MNDSSELRFKVLSEVLSVLHKLLTGKPMEPLTPFPFQLTLVLLKRLQ